MKKYSISAEQREKDIYACMVQNLFDELKFFGSYPPKELNITAILFGQIIKQRVVDDVVIKIGYKCIHEALTADGKFFDFGKTAIMQCLDSIDDKKVLEDY